MSDNPFSDLPPREKRPTRVRTIETWIQQADEAVGIGAKRLGWMVASTIVVTALQRKVDEDGAPLILVKGGTYLELRLGLRSRATKDVDMLLRGNFEALASVVDDALSTPFDGIVFDRTEFKTLEIDTRTKRPVRFDVLLTFKGRVWRKIALDVAPDEGSAGIPAESFDTPSLAHFGIQTPLKTLGIAMAYQVAQKIHACSRPETDDRKNNRVRDIVDLLLLKREFYDGGRGLRELRAACLDIFSYRRQDTAAATGVEGRRWPAELKPPARWADEYPEVAKAVGITDTFNEATLSVNRWILDIDQGQQ